MSEGLHRSLTRFRETHFTRPNRRACSQAITKLEHLPRLFHSHKMHLLDLLGLFYDQYNRFPYPFKYLMLEKGTPFGQSLPSPPPPSPKYSMRNAKGHVFTGLKLGINFNHLGLKSGEGLCFLEAGSGIG